jgi:drug/metabolite transporter (DMT)-like permease
MSPAESGQFRATVLGIVAVLLAAASWGASGIFVKLIMAAGPVSSLSLAFWRDSAAFVLFLSLALGIDRHRINIQRADWPALAGMGISLGVFHVFLNLGYRLNGAAITTIQQAAMPAIVLVLARLVWREPLTRVKILSLITIGVGTTLVSGLLHVDAADVSAGSILVGFLVPAFYAGWSLFGKALRSGYSAVVILAWAFGIAASILLPFQLASGHFLPPLIPTRSLWWFGGLTGISTVFAFFAFIFALGRLPAGIASILVMSEIAFAVFYAYLFLEEALSLVEIFGAIVIVAGVTVLLKPGPAATTVRPASHQ